MVILNNNCLNCNKVGTFYSKNCLISMIPKCLRFISLIEIMANTQSYMYIYAFNMKYYVISFHFSLVKV